MRFGLFLRENSTPEWRPMFLDYSRIKKLTASFVSQANSPAKLLADSVGPSDWLSSICDETERVFLAILQLETAKINKFYAAREEELLHRWAYIRDKIAAVKSLPSRSARSQFVHGLNSLERACVECYWDVDILTNYSVINHTGIIKSVKKLLKTVQHGKLQREQVVHYLEGQPFCDTDKIKTVRLEIEAVVSEVFEGGNRALAMSKLRLTLPAQTHWHSYSSGVLLGIVFLLLILMVLLHAESAVRDLDNFDGVFRVFRFLAFCVAVTWCWTWNVCGLEAKHVKYCLLLDLDPRCRQIFHLWLLKSGAVGVAWLLGYVMYLANGLGYIWIGIPVFVYPFLTFVAILALLFVFLPTSYPASLDTDWSNRSSAGILKSLARCLLAPYPDVTFVDIFLADQLCSLTRLLSDLEFSICFFLSGMWTKGDNSCYSSAVLPVVTLVPFWCRLMQCVRRYCAAEKPSPAASMHGFNCIKYVSSLLLVVLSIVWTQTGATAAFAFWVLAAVGSAALNCYWDFVMDWGLLGPAPKFRFLKDFLQYEEPWVYYWAMASNAVLRIAWVFAVSDFASLGSLSDSGYSYFFGMLEIFRRFQWNFFRFEHEHLSNSENLRSVKLMPLPHIPHPEPLAADLDLLPAGYSHDLDLFLASEKKTIQQLERSPRSPRGL
eukprot:gnl/Hemi2/12731_TR4347_c0_g1_i1.p1 gnl/Hemi2/12731_TR4347_c0_g1~~gnl/Hemi2/12731_TR4347_c0_g1_i1.p1  ORF type:complete len:662 (+),score=208.55 gnl/Hemi2/12731_TR4347_c0_g1_i1:146-2131(+)